MHDSVHQTRELTHVTGTNRPWLDVQTSVDIFESSQIEGLCVRDLLCVCVFGLFSRFSAVVNVFIGCETDKNAPLSWQLSCL